LVEGRLGKKLRPLISGVDKAEFCLVEFVIPGGITTPEEFASAMAGAQMFLSGDKVVLISGRGPDWGYGMLLHAAHPAPAVGIYDPWLRGYVVAATDSPDYTLGQVIPDPEEKSA
jgi:CRISPR-associated protein Csx3